MVEEGVRTSINSKVEPVDVNYCILCYLIKISHLLLCLFVSSEELVVFLWTHRFSLSVLVGPGWSHHQARNHKSCASLWTGSIMRLLHLPHNLKYCHVLPLPAHTSSLVLQNSKHGSPQSILYDMGFS
jgi:hypothetical protein